MKPDRDTPPPRLSDELFLILKLAAGNSLTLRQIIEILHGRAFNIIVVLLALPFCTPIPLFGLSTPFGFALMIFGLRIALRKKPWLPEAILNRQIPYPTLEKIISVTLRAAYYMEKILHPRLEFLHRWTTFSVLNGLIIALNAFCLMLPLPIPFTNMLPAVSIVLLAAGMMEEDGAAILAGYIAAVISMTYFIFLLWVGKAGVKLGAHWLGY
ncbi:MAG TPA: exopolysaccharide biosynthesis protein [Candidatus Manganitrophaceae bacterium]|nr:exopolysaccharide biosynthesis protein [Candidatus Manganitrophaceae bacterium]